MPHLRYDMNKAIDCGVKVSARKNMTNLRIRYFWSTPQSVADQWWFWCCSNIPDPLPPYLSVIQTDPAALVGYGLTVDEARAIVAYEAKQQNHT